MVTSKRKQKLKSDSHDTIPSILDYKFQRRSESPRLRSSEGEPTKKSQKVAQSSKTSTIRENLSSGSYQSPNELLKDVKKASDELLAPLKGANSSDTINSNVRQSDLSLDEIRLQAGVLAFRKVLVNLILRETREYDSDKTKDSTNGVLESDTSVKPETVDESSGPGLTEDVQEPKTVLTLFANASGPRQLFSSLQRPVRVSSNRQANHLDTSVHVSLPLSGANLPHILSTTQITPIHTSNIRKSAKKDCVSTLKDIFSPPAHLPPLQPPKSAKPLSNRSATVSWLPHTRSSHRDRHAVQTYPTQNLSTGQWLGYGGVELPREPFSPEAKRKQRDRALSTGEANPPPTQDALAAIEVARRDALFRSAYSSFAPNHDDSVAIVPEKVKSRVWWHKVNEIKSGEHIILDPALEEASSDSLVRNEQNSTNEIDEFKEASENFEPETMDNAIRRSSVADDGKEIQDLLGEISDLLETLYSYQKIRNSSITSPGRPAIGQSAPVQTSAGSGSQPSDAEFDVYKMLKSQLSMMVSMLPPFAVAKLNGEQLADLGISKKIVIETKDYKGVMEEDQLSKIAKQTASLGTANRLMHTQPTAQHSPATSHYNRPSPVARQAHVAASYYPQQQPPARTPAANPQRHVGYAQSYHTPNSASKSAYRPMRTNYDNQNAKFSQHTNYSHINAVQHYQHQQQQRPHQGYPYSPHQYPQASMAQGHNYAQIGTPANQVSQANAYSPQGYSPQPNSHAMNSVAPMKTPQQNQQHGNMRAPYSAQLPGANRSQYLTPNGLQMGYQSSSARSARPTTPSSLGPSGFHTSMTTEQQQLMMDRQRAQLGMQAQAHAQAANMVAQHVLPTPTPPASTPHSLTHAQPQQQQQYQQQQQQSLPQPLPQHQISLPPTLSHATTTTTPTTSSVDPPRDVQMMNGHPESQINGRTTVA